MAFGGPTSPAVSWEFLFRPEFCLNDDSFGPAAVMPLAEPAGTLVRCKHVYLTPSRKGAGMYL